jgi:hypothetical protein
LITTIRKSAPLHGLQELKPNSKLIFGGANKNRTCDLILIRDAL